MMNRVKLCGGQGLISGDDHISDRRATAIKGMEENKSEGRGAQSQKRETG